MRFYGRAGYGAISSIWEDTLAGLRGIVPGWFGPKTVTIDVSDTRSAPQELAAAMAGVPPDATVVLSARAQKALIAICGNEQAELDRIAAMSASVPADLGERIRTAVLQRQRALDDRVQQIVRAQADASRAGVPDADLDEAEASRLLAWPAVVVIGVAIVAACALVGAIIFKAMDAEKDTYLVGTALDEAIASGNWDIIPEILGTAVKPPTEFPWGWVIGGVTVVALGIGGFFFLGEYAKEKGRAAAGAKA